RPSAHTYSLIEVTLYHFLTTVIYSFVVNKDRLYTLEHSFPTRRSSDLIGSLNTCTIHPREILKGAILSNSAAVVLCHIGMKNQWRNYNLLYPQCYINFAFFLMAKLSLKVGWR